MNYIFSFFIIISIVFSFINGTQGEIISTITTSLTDCATLVFKLMFLSGFFGGIMKIAEDNGLVEKLGGFIRKIVKKIFNTRNESAIQKMTLNISANMLGIGNAATPMGLLAMKELDCDNNHAEKPSYDMCKFMIFNTCSVQLIPTTVMSLRATDGSTNPAIIMLPVLLTSILSLSFGLLILKLLFKWKGN